MDPCTSSIAFRRLAISPSIDDRDRVSIVDSSSAKYEWGSVLRLARDVAGEIRPLTGYYAMLIERIEGYRRSPPPPDWDGNDPMAMK